MKLSKEGTYEFTSGELVTNLYDRLVQYDAEDTTVLTLISADVEPQKITVSAPSSP